MAEVDSVLEGKSIFIDWKSGLEPAIFVKWENVYAILYKDRVQVQHSCRRPPGPPGPEACVYAKLSGMGLL